MDSRIVCYTHACMHIQKMNMCTSAIRYHSVMNIKRIVEKEAHVCNMIIIIDNGVILYCCSVYAGGVCCMFATVIATDNSKYFSTSTR